MPDRWLNSQGSSGDPLSWWGHRAEPVQPISVVQLIEQGNLDARVAAFLWLAMERQASIVVAALPLDAGKTTMLTALLDFLPADIQTLHLHGLYERFEFLSTTGPDNTYLLCNEISSHLPIYLWGRGVRRLFEVMESGYGMATTIHAAGASEVCAFLKAFPLEVPESLLSQIDLVLTLGMGHNSSGRVVRRAMCLEAISTAGGQPVAETLAERDVLLGDLQSRPGRLIGVLCERFGYEPNEATTELARRERLLERLRRDSIFSPAEVRAALHRSSSL